MDRVAVAGLSIRQAPQSELERFALLTAGPIAGRDGAHPQARLLHELADVLGASELVFLQTCNRIEVVYGRETGHLPSRDDLPQLAAYLASHSARKLEPSPQLLECMYVKSSLDAARHLFRVASSLESLAVGEDQILSQVRAAFAFAERAGLTGPLLRPLFEQTFQVAKLVRARTELSRIPVSIASLACEAAGAAWQECGASEEPRVAVVGAGEMSRLVARTLLQTGWKVAWFVNRSMARAAELAVEHGGDALDLDRFRKGALPVDVIFSATSAPGPIFTRADLHALRSCSSPDRPLIAVDLAQPRDFEPPDAEEASEREKGRRTLQRIDLEALRERAEANRSRRAAAATHAEALIEERLASIPSRTRQRRVDSLLAELSQDSRELLESSLAELRTGRLAELDEEDIDLVERWARHTFARLNHLPIAALKRMAGAPSEDGLDQP
jgi:glutamyl-tRNA reductase